MTGERAISATGLVKAYRKGPRALDGIDLEVGAGEVVGLLGPNGAGKTTTVKILLGLATPDAGDARLFGVPSAEPAARRQVGYLPERFAYPEWLTGLQLLGQHARLAGLASDEAGPAAVDVLGQVGLAGRGDDRIGGYSKGMQQRLGLAAAMLGEPRLLVLDEPTSALDPIGRREVRELIRSLRERGVAVLLNSHLLSEVEQVCDRVVVLDRGRVVGSGTLADLARSHEVRVELEAPHLDDAVLATLQGMGTITARDGATVLLALDDADSVPDLAIALVQAGARIKALVPLAPSLEEVFVGLVGSGETGGGQEGS